MNRNVELMKLRADAQKQLTKMGLYNGLYIEARAEYQNAVERLDQLAEKLILDLAERESKDCEDCQL